MTKCEVEFDGDKMTVRGKDIWKHDFSNEYVVGAYNDCDVDGGDIEDMFPTLEQAIKYCLEN